MTEGQINKFLKENKNLFNEFDNLKCTICKNILIDPQGSLCGCNFCKECLDNYVRTHEYCPGLNEECRKMILNENICPNNIIKLKINKLIIKCPTNNCNYEGKLCDIVEHKISCFEIVQCPLKEYGCNMENIDATHLNNHILENIGNHSSMIIDSQTKKFDEMERKINEIQLENSKLKESFLNEFEKMKIENTKLKDKIKTLENKTRNLKEIDYSNDYFEWTINNLCLKRKQGCSIEYSVNFYTNLKYRMRLCIVFDGDKCTEEYLGLYHQFVRGDYDNELYWPCKRKIVCGLKNLYTEEYVDLEVDKYDNRDYNFFAKPRSMNKEFGYEEFISWDVLERSEYLRDDSICVILRLE